MPFLRVEICRLDGTPVADIVGGATLAVGDLPTQAGAQPAAPASGAVRYAARVEAIGAPIYVAVGAAPDPCREPRMLLLPRRLVDGRSTLRLRPGERVAAVLAADIDWPL